MLNLLAHAETANDVAVKGSFLHELSEDLPFMALILVAIIGSIFLFGGKKPKAKIILLVTYVISAGTFMSIGRDKPILSSFAISLMIIASFIALEKLITSNPRRKTNV